jgi:hypothetical protein
MARWSASGWETGATMVVSLHTRASPCKVRAARIANPLPPGIGAIGVINKPFEMIDIGRPYPDMSRIPRIAHFVFGLREQSEPFHLLHYLSIESCRRILQPEAIFLHYHHLPFGVYWDAIRPHLNLIRVAPVQEVASAHYDPRLVPERYRYAHHADFVRLDALIEHGGVYADIDTLFLRPLPDSLFEERFVIGREPEMQDELTGELKPSLCNALLMAQPGAEFARVWRARMAGAINGAWSNHSGFLAQSLSEELPAAVRVEPEPSFFPVPCTPVGIDGLLRDGRPDLSHSYLVHLWAHVWWNQDRTDFSSYHAGDFTLPYLRASRSPLAKLARPYLPAIDIDDLPV